MNLGIKKISIDEFKILKASNIGRGGNGGSRQEYFAFKELEPGQAIAFKYEDEESFNRGKIWAFQLKKRRNDLNKCCPFVDVVANRNKLEVYVALKNNKEDE